MTTNTDDRLNLKSAGHYLISGHSLTICLNFGLFCQNTRVFFIVSLKEKQCSLPAGKCRSYYT